MNCFHANKKLIAGYGRDVFYSCPDCSQIFNATGLEKKIEPENYDDFYKTNGSRFYSAIEIAVMAFRFIRALNIAVSNVSAKSLLDIGSGRGYMLFFLKKYFGFTAAVGTQISRPALEFSRKKLGLEIYGQDLLEINFGSQLFDVISIFHVLEHLKNPEEYITKINSLLKPGGKIYIEVPNFNSWTKKITRRFWLGLDFQHHIFFFSPDSLKALLQKNNFIILKIRTFSWEYSAFTSAQSLISWLTKSDHVFYQFLQTKKLNFKNIFHSFLFLILFPVCLIINLLLYFTNYGENLRIIAQKK
jgi:2-polyprenyl-3-methyl-5-hydroxy-6-metoxy-1,4-benzoquinol methylase